MPEADALRRTALVLVLAGLLWSLIEAVVSLWAGLQSGSVAILAFGLDSIVEFLAGAVLVWRLKTERDELESEAAERRAQRLLGLSFFLLAAYIVLHSGRQPAGMVARASSQPCGHWDCGCKRRRNDCPLHSQDAHRHPHAVPGVASRGHGKPLLRPPRPDHLGRPRPQYSLFTGGGPTPSQPSS